MVPLTIRLMCLRPSHTSSRSANLASEQTVKAVKMKNETTSLEILFPSYLIDNACLHSHCFGSSLPHLSFAFLIIVPCSSPFIHSHLYVWVLLSSFEASNLLSILLASQTSLLDSFHLSTFEIIFSSLFPVSP